MHVHFLMDEFANVSLPNDFEKILSTMRGRGVSASIIIQNMAQLRALFDKQWESIVGNCDEFLYLGGNEQSTHKYVSELLGKETIDLDTHGRTTGRGGSWSTNQQISGRELMTPDEVRMLDNSRALLFVRGERPIIDLKLDIARHPAARLTPEGGAPPLRATAPARWQAPPWRPTKALPPRARRPRLRAASCSTGRRPRQRSRRRRRAGKENQRMRKTTEGKKARPAARARLMAAIAVCAASALALEPPAAFAATDPIAAVDNLSTFIFGLIRSVGLILLGFGVVQVGMSLKSHDPSQRANGFLTLAGGVVITFAKEILDIIVG